VRRCPERFSSAQSGYALCMSKCYELEKNSNVRKQVKYSQTTFFPFSPLVS
jgi:hypothetical protein